MPKIDSTALHRWRTARRISLGAIVIAGTMATAAAVTNRVAQHPCNGSAHVNSYSYSGIGVELAQDGDDFVVARVFPGTPADGKLRAGMVLLSVDGEHPDHIQAWTNRIRGTQGSTVELEVASPCAGHRETLVLERELIELGQDSHDNWRR